jgi:hypothetical protein
MNLLRKAGLMSFSAIALVAALATGAKPAKAQGIQNLGPSPILAGVPVSCGGANTFVVPGLADIAMARPEGIFLRSDFFMLPGIVQVFTYAHECAHLAAVGGNESAADCWAVQLGRNQGWLTGPGLQVVGQFFINNPGDWTHAPGPQRVALMWQCMQTP